MVLKKIGLDKKKRMMDLHSTHPKAVLLKKAFVKRSMTQLPGWALSGKFIFKNFEFNNFYETIGFVNAVAYIANQEDHHPDLTVGYKSCWVRYSTTSLGGLSILDFVCAIKINQLVQEISS